MNVSAAVDEIATYMNCLYESCGSTKDAAFNHLKVNEPLNVTLPVISPPVFL